MRLAIILVQFAGQQAGGLAPIIRDAAAKYDQDPYLVASVIEVESDYRGSICHKGAFGLMQVQTKYHSCNEVSRLRAEELNLLNPRANIERGAKLMRLWKNFCTKHHDGGHHWLLHYNQGYGVCPNGKRRCRKKNRTPITEGHVGGYADRVLHVRSLLKHAEATR